MQVVILCGGQGTRIRDVAEDIPKPMIPIGERPILWHIMKGYARFGLNDFILCLGYKSWVIKRFFLDYHMAHVDFTLRLGASKNPVIHNAGPREDWQVTLAETGLESMTGCRIKRIEPYLKSETVLVTYGDGVTDLNIADLLAFHHQHGRLGTVTAVRPPGRFGELEIKDRQVVGFSEKPPVAQGWVSGGFFVFHRSLWDRLAEDPQLVLEREPLMDLARDGELMAFPHQGFWHPMDNSRDYRYLNDLWAADKAPWKTWSGPVLSLAA